MPKININAANSIKHSNNEPIPNHVLIPVSSASPTVSCLYVHIIITRKSLLSCVIAALATLVHNQHKATKQPPDTANRHKSILQPLRQYIRQHVITRNLPFGFTPPRPPRNDVSTILSHIINNNNRTISTSSLNTNHPTHPHLKSNPNLHPQKPIPPQ